MAQIGLRKVVCSESSPISLPSARALAARNRGNTTMPSPASAAPSRTSGLFVCRLPFTATASGQSKTGHRSPYPEFGVENTIVSNQIRRRFRPWSIREVIRGSAHHEVVLGKFANDKAVVVRHRVAYRDIELLFNEINMTSCGNQSYRRVRELRDVIRNNRRDQI